MKLKIMTLNGNYDKACCGNEWPSRREIIKDIINLKNPDIVALQALCRDYSPNKDIDQATEIGRLCGYPYIWFEPASTRDQRMEGSAILSKMSITASAHTNLTLLSGLEDSNSRIVMYCRFDFPFGPFHLINAHFSWIAEQNNRNLAETMNVLNSIKGPAMLVGDLNAPDFTPLMDPLLSEGWTDAWAHLNPNEEGHTFPSNNPQIRIDYVWANDLLKSSLKEIKIIANKPDSNGAMASDHHGLLVSVDI